MGKIWIHKGKMGYIMDTLGSLPDRTFKNVPSKINSDISQGDWSLCYMTIVLFYPKLNANIM